MKTKYKIGDIVYGATCYKKNIKIQCPDCKGEKVWKVELPNGEKFTVPCSTCEHGYEGCDGLITTWQQSPTIIRLTIGSIKVDTNDKEHPILYMCEETGIGSGTNYIEEKLFINKFQALKYATEKAIKLCREETERQRKIYDLDKKSSKKNKIRK